MGADVWLDAYEKGKNLALGDAQQAESKEDAKARWREEWAREKAMRDAGYVCSSCLFFKRERDHPLLKTFPDLGICQRTGHHRLATASCTLGIWKGKPRPDVQAVTTSH